jgi:hypothetical protein
MSPHPAILDYFRASSHPLPAVTICRRCNRWQKIPLGPSRPLDSPKIERRRGWRCPRIGQRP